MRRRILVADDDVDAAEALALVLRHLGHEVQVVHDGRAALEAARMYGPQLVLLDLAMPGVDGYRVVERLRLEERFAGLPFIAVTASGGPDDVRRTREAGFAAHLLKPVPIETLRAVLARF